ncbi:MAG: hypothetical protein ACI835_000068 [Planctomycetota bacterium]|jgi:hypothetical protein
MAVWKIERRKADCAGPACGREFEEGDRHISCLVLRTGEFVREDLCLSCWKARQEAMKNGEALVSEPVAEPDSASGEGAAQDGEALTTEPEAAEATTSADAAPAPEGADGSATEATEATEAGVESDVNGEELFWWKTRHSVNKKRTVQLDLASLERLFVQLEGREEVKVRELRYILCLLLMRKRRLKVEKVDRGAEGESFIVKRPRVDERYRVWVYDFDAERMDAVRAQLQAVFDGAETDAGLPETLIGDDDEFGATDADESAEDAVDSEDGDIGPVGADPEDEAGDGSDTNAEADAGEDLVDATEEEVDQAPAAGK